jgi:hypothetical protein
VLAGWFHITEKADKTDQGWGIDPNGAVLDAAPPLQPVSTSGT